MSRGHRPPFPVSLAYLLAQKIHVPFEEQKLLPKFDPIQGDP